MKFGLTHRILTSALAALGVLAIVLSGALPRVSVVLLVIGLVAALCATDRFQHSTAARYAAAIIPSALLGIEFLRLVGGAPLLDLAVEFAAALQIVRVATRRGAMHDQQVVLLALLHLVAGTVLGGGLAYGMCLFGFLILAPGALVLSHLRREVEGNYRQGARDRTGLPVDVPRILRSRRVIGPGFLALTCGLSLPILLFTAILFILFPRVGLSLLLFQNQHAYRTTGFDDKVDLSGIGAIRIGSTVVLRFRPSHLEDPPPAKMVLRLRGTAFDEYAGSGKWARTLTERVALSRAGGDVPFRRFPEPGDNSIAIELEPLDPQVIFLPARTVAMRWAAGMESGSTHLPPILRTAEQTIRYESAAERVLRYEVFVAPPYETIDEPLSERDRTRYLQRPTDMPKRIGDLARTWIGDASTDSEKADRILRHLATEYRYSLDAPSGGKDNPIDDFLFESRAGHCEFFSTAMALMLRTVDIPSRNVSGFLGGTYNRWGGFYAVRSGDAHSWVEAYIDDGTKRGWVTYDPTPPDGAQPLADHGGVWGFVRDVFEAISQGWDRYVVGYDLPTQVGILQRIQRAMEGARRSVSSRGGGGPRSISKRTWIIMGGVVIGGAMIAIVIWQRRRKKRGSEDTASAGKARQHRLATQLWLQLEEALQQRGHTRPRNVPPVRFSEIVRDERHDALGDEVHLLACRYALARFGNVAFSSEEQREFERRVQRIRASSARDIDELPAKSAPLS